MIVQIHMLPCEFPYGQVLFSSVSDVYKVIARMYLICRLTALNQIARLPCVT